MKTLVLICIALTLSGHMLPVRAVDNFPNCGVGNSIFDSESRLCDSASMPFANIANGVVGKLGMPIYNALGSPSFFDLVINVLGLSSKEQMIGVYASRGIAFVENIQSIRNWAALEFPRDAMHKLRAFSNNPDLAISFIVEAAQPNPASIGHRNLGEEPVAQRLDSMNYLASIATTSFDAGPKDALMGGEFLPASGADKLNFWPWTLALSDLGSHGLISLLIWLLVFAICIYVVFIILGMLPLPPPIRTIITLVVGLICLLVLLQHLQLF